MTILYSTQKIIIRIENNRLLAHYILTDSTSFYEKIESKYIPVFENIFFRDWINNNEFTLKKSKYQNHTRYLQLKINESIFYFKLSGTIKN